jgi:hypothetical protein
MKRVICIVIVVLAVWFSNAMSAGANAPANLIDGSFVHFGYSDTTPALTIDQFKQLLNEMRSLGMDTIILDAVRIKKSAVGCGGGGDDFYWVAGFPSKLQDVLDEAQKRGMMVYLGAVMSFMNCDDFHKSPNKDLVYQDIKTNIKLIADSYKNHPAFAGWYIPDETGADSSLIKKMSYYHNITSQLKQLTPGKKVIISPYLQPGALSPSDLAYVAAFFRDGTGIDIQAWQDGTGAFANPPSSDGQAQYSTEDYYAQLVDRLGSEAVWADIELFNFKSYSSASVARLNNQLSAAQLPGKRVSWLFQSHMSPSWGPNAGYKEARRLFRSYQALYGFKGAYLSYEGSYRWITPPASQYPDLLGELNNSRTEDPRNPFSTGWVGVLGNAQFIFDFSSPANVDWLGVHIVLQPSSGITSPAKVQVRCSTDGTGFGPAKAVIPSVPGADYSSSSVTEYVISNSAPLNFKGCKSLSIKLINTQWTFLSEVEIAHN